MGSMRDMSPGFGSLEPDDPARLPDAVGGGCIVIDGSTGEVVARPLLDPETVAELWPGRRPR